MRCTLSCLLPIITLLAGCVSNPDQSIFVMPAPISVNAGPSAAPGGLALIVRQVVLPDYLDTTDLVTRSGLHGIEASRTGRWGERLSKGMTRSLAADLADRLHATLVAEGPAVQIEVAVSAFDVTTGASVLEAGWTVVWQGDGRVPVTGHGTFIASVAQPADDLAVVAAMTKSVAELSEGIEATVPTHAM
jgi:uncharacterized lipoprotein YmbA